VTHTKNSCFETNSKEIKYSDIKSRTIQSKTFSRNQLKISLFKLVGLKMIRSPISSTCFF